MSPSSLKLNSAELRAEIYRRKLRAFEPSISLAQFVRDGWHVLEPTAPLVDNWHIDAICLHVEAVLVDWIRRQLDPDYVQRLRDLLINVPPGTAKSRLVSVFTPAWMWSQYPSWRAIYTSANPRVALRDSMYCKDVLESEWYQDTFQPKWRIREDQDSKGCYWNDAGGTRAAFGFFAKITGDRGDALFVDDPHDAAEVNSDAKREAVLDRWNSAIRNRVNDPAASVRIGIMQRVHEADWSALALAQGFEHLCLPMEYEPKRYEPDAKQHRIPRVTAIGWSDPRKEEGELLFPARFPPEVLAVEKTTLGTTGYAGQHQQRPSPAEGVIFLRKYWKRYSKAPERFDELVMSWDMTFKDTKGSDYVVGQVWGRAGADFYLLDQVRDKMDFSRTVTEFESLCQKWPRARRRMVEDKANGPAVISALKRKITGIIAIEPDGSKFARAVAHLPEIEAGNVHLPTEAAAEFDVEAFISEHAAFPGGAHDDQVDACSQALRHFTQSGSRRAYGA